MNNENNVPNGEQAPIYAAVDVNECTHVGYFVGFGMECFAITETLYHVITAKCCIRCGKDFRQLAVLQVPTPESSNILHKKGGLVS